MQYNFGAFLQDIPDCLFRHTRLSINFQHSSLFV